MQSRTPSFKARSAQSQDRILDIYIGGQLIYGHSTNKINKKDSQLVLAIHTHIKANKIIQCKWQQNLSPRIWSKTQKLLSGTSWTTLSRKCNIHSLNLIDSTSHSTCKYKFDISGHPHPQNSTTSPVSGAKRAFPSAEAIELTSVSRASHPVLPSTTPAPASRKGKIKAFQWGWADNTLNTGTYLAPN